MKKRILLSIAALAGFLLLAQLMGGCQLLERWLSPPAVALREAYAADKTGPSVDHSALDRVVREFVTQDGQVRYSTLRSRPADLDAYIAQLGKVEFAPLPRDEKLALLINAYNAFTLRLILDHWPVESIRDIPAAERWDARRWKIGTMTLSLTEIENDYLRSRFREPRIHFAINCASIGCPPLRREAYRGEVIERQLEEQSRKLHADKAWLDLQAENQTIRLTRLYLWFEGDFIQIAGTPLAYAGRFSPALAAELDAGRAPGIDWIPYDWGLNGTVSLGEPR